MIKIVPSLFFLAANYLFLKEAYFLSTFQEFASVTIFLLCSFLLISLISLVIPAIFFSCLVYLYLLIASIINYFKFYYKIVVSSTLIQSVIHTDAREASELFNLSFLIWFMLTGILPCILFWLTTKYTSLLRKKANDILIIGTFLITGLVSNICILPANIHTFRYLSNALCSFMPFNYIISLKNYLSLYKTTNSAENITKVFTFEIDTTDQENLNVILVIGESARADRWGINGYQRNTTPNLAHLQNLITYKEAYSLATNTPLGIQSIMKKEGYYHLSSFIKVFDQLKFKTYWFSNQGTRYKLINLIAAEASENLFSDDIRISNTGNNYDTDLIPFVQDILVKNKNKSNMVVLHTIGSHRLYDLRYPNEFKVFNPTCINNELYYSTNECLDAEKLGNSYDNTIVYTDYFLSELIEILGETNSILIYISDHGESLGENGIYAHSYPFELAPIEQKHIPLIIWASKKFLAKKTNLDKFLNASKKTGIKVDQSSIFHSILDCVGIKSEAIDYNKSLCH